MDKRQQILDAALELFAEKGYDAVGVDEIAESIGMKGPALYYYYKSKEAILDAINEVTEAHYEQNFGKAGEQLHIPDSMEELIAVSLARFQFTIHDPRIKISRRFLVKEQFRNEKLKKLNTRHTLLGVERLYTIIFEKMMEKGILKQDDPKILAFEFSTPVSLLVNLVDREPEMEAEAMERFNAHMNHFAKMYGVNGTNKS